MRKKRARCLLCLFLLLLLLSGCGSKVPEVIKNPNTEFVTLEAYGEKNYVVPENYEHIRDNIYAVVKDGHHEMKRQRIYRNGTVRCRLIFSLDNMGSKAFCAWPGPV